MKTLAEELRDEELMRRRRALHTQAQQEGPMSTERAAWYCEQMERLMPEPPEEPSW